MGFTMVMITAARCAAALAAGALLVWAPMAHADDPVDTDTAQQDENQQPGDNQGDQGPGIAKDVVDKVGDAAKDLTKQQGRPNQQLTGKMMAELTGKPHHLVNVNGVPECHQDGAPKWGARHPGNSGCAADEVLTQRAQ